MKTLGRSSFYLSLAVTALGSAAQANVIEGFENSSDPGNWQAVSPVSQTFNAENPAVAPIFSPEHVTEGIQSGDFTTTWTIPGATATSNPYMVGGALTYWGIRYNVGSPGLLNGNVISTADGVIQADVFNANPYPVSMSIYVDTISNGQIERGPFIEFPANSAGTYTWNLAEVAPVGWVTGNGSFDGAPNAQVKGIFLYTETEPTEAASHFFVDNIQNLTSQADVTAPAVPVPYSAVQGPTPGTVVVTWKPNTEPDLAGYRIYMATDTNFGQPTINRLTFPLTHLADVPAGTNMVTLTGMPVEENVYLQIRAYDNATPILNESIGGASLGVRLRSDGGPVDDHVILDYDRAIPGTAAFALEGYSHGIVYNGRALLQVGRYYDSATADAIDDGQYTLVPSITGITIWSNLLDGTAGASVALSDQSVAALTAFSDAEGNLLISGTGLSEGLTTSGLTQQTFLADVLKAELVNPNINVAEITGTAPLDAMGVVATDESNFLNSSSYPTSSNEALAALEGAVATGTYTGSESPNAAVVHSNKVVLLGYAFESVAGADIATSEAVRAALLQDAVDYLLDTSHVADWTLY